MYGRRGKSSYFCTDYIDYTNFLKQMISNWFYYCFTLLIGTLILSSCLNSNDTEDYEFSSDAQITSLKISSNQDSLKVLSKVNFSIDQVSSAPLIFNKDSLPYLFDVSMVSMNINTNRSSGIKIHLANPDSSYIWNNTDSVMIKKLKHIEVYAEDGRTTKTYTFQLRTHQQDPDKIYWQNVKSNYINSPTDQVTVSTKDKFFTFYKVNNALLLSTSSIDDGVTWTTQTLSGLPQDVELTSIQNNTLEEKEIWLALDTNGKVYKSVDGKTWTNTLSALSVKSIFGKIPSIAESTNAKDSILAVVNDGGKFKFAKTTDFSSIRILNEIPLSFPVKDFTFTTINDSLIYTAKYLVATGGKDIYNNSNTSVWILQEDENKITHTSKRLKFNVKGSSLFNYDKKVYLMTSEENKNVFYTSTSYGLVWEKSSNKQSLPAEFINRSNQSVCVDSKNFIWIFGGASSSQNQIVDIWKGRINKLLIK